MKVETFKAGHAVHSEATRPVASGVDVLARGVSICQTELQLARGYATWQRIPRAMKSRLARKAGW